MAEPRPGGYLGRHDPATTQARINQPPTIGGLIARWRKGRRLSQLDLALESGISSRHLSFIETGRTRPSRDMVLRLCGVLAVPLRDRNNLLLAAGFAPVYRETALDAPEMAEILSAVRMILRRHEPYPAVAFDAGWDVVMANTAYAGMVNALLPPVMPCSPSSRWWTSRAPTSSGCSAARRGRGT